MLETRTDLRALTEEQVSAVLATEGRVRVVAGAGSGKTRTLVYRYAFLMDDMGIPQSDILCMTFTNKAAQEMKSRIGALSPGGVVGDFVTTIHGFCVKFLRKEIYRLPELAQRLSAGPVKGEIVLVVAGLSRSEQRGTTE